MSTIVCENHCCKKPLDKEGVACSLCRQAQYCSNKCAIIDWPAHACDNVFHVKDTIRSHVIATPYHFEDCMSEAQLDAIPSTDAARQQIMMQQVDDNLVTHSRLHASLAEQIERGPFEPAAVPIRGKCPSKEGSYQLLLTVDGQECAHVSGDLRRNTIYAENEINAAARKLGGGEVQAQSNRWTKPVNGSLSENTSLFSTLHKDATIFWPALSESSIPLQGELHAQLSVQGGMPRSICADYNFSYWDQESVSDAVQQHTVRKWQQKLGDANLPSNIASIRACAPNGDAIIITAHVDQDTAHVLDVEYIVPEYSAEDEWTNVQTNTYDPDPNDTAQMVGLAMALQVAAHENEHLAPLADTIRLYAEQKEKGQVEHLTPHIASAVTEAVHALHDMHIERRKGFQETNWFDRGAKKGRRFLGKTNVIMRVKKIKRSKSDVAQKELELQTLYNQLLDNATKAQEGDAPGLEYLQQAKQVAEISAQPDRKNPTGILLATDEYRVAQLWQTGRNLRKWAQKQKALRDVEDNY